MLLPFETLTREGDFCHVLLHSFEMGVPCREVRHWFSSKNSVYRHHHIYILQDSVNWYLGKKEQWSVQVIVRWSKVWLLHFLKNMSCVWNEPHALCITAIKELRLFSLSQWFKLCSRLDFCVTCHTFKQLRQRDTAHQTTNLTQLIKAYDIKLVAVNKILVLHLFKNIPANWSFTYIKKTIESNERN
jgi:hypothetical protein